MDRETNFIAIIVRLADAHTLKMANKYGRIMQELVFLQCIGLQLQFNAVHRATTSMEREQKSSTLATYRHIYDCMRFGNRHLD